MRYFLALATCMIFASISHSQSAFNIEPTASFEQFQPSMSYPRRRHFNRRYKWRGALLATGGVAAGPETFFALKGSILGRVAYSHKLQRFNREFTMFGVHGGAEFSCFGLFAAWGSAGLNAGISIGPVTLDGSLTFWVIGLNEVYFGTTTYNPKVGIQVLDCVWLKAGYSYFLRGETPLPNWMKIGKNQVNLEALIVVPLPL